MKGRRRHVAHLESGEFGGISYEDSDVYQFPEGLPGFEQTRRFLLYSPPQLAPLRVLIHITEPSLRFYTVDLNLVAPACTPALGEEAASVLHLEVGRKPDQCLALVTWLEGDRPTVNLLAPVVLNPQERLGMQLIQFESGYSYRHPLLVEAQPC